MNIYFYQKFSVINIEEHRRFSKRDFPNPKKNVILDVKLSSVLFGIDFSIASDGFLFCQKTVYHIFGKSDGIA